MKNLYLYTLLVTEKIFIANTIIDVLMIYSFEINNTVRQFASLVTFHRTGRPARMAWSGGRDEIISRQARKVESSSTNYHCHGRTSTERE